MSAHVTTYVPHAGEGTHTLVIAVEISDTLLTSRARDHELQEHVRQLVADALAEHRAGPTPMHMATICVGVVSRQYDRWPDELTSRSHNPEVVRARMEAMWLAYRRAGLSYSEAGRLFDRDHTTVLSAVRRIDEKLQDDPRLGWWLDRCWALACSNGDWAETA